MIIGLNSGKPISLKMLHIHMASRALAANDRYSTSELDCAISSCNWLFHGIGAEPMVNTKAEVDFHSVRSPR